MGTRPRAGGVGRETATPVEPPVAGVLSAPRRLTGPAPWTDSSARVGAALPMSVDGQLFLTRTADQDDMRRRGRHGRAELRRIEALAAAAGLTVEQFSSGPPTASWKGPASLRPPPSPGLMSPAAASVSNWPQYTWPSRTCHLSVAGRCRTDAILCTLSARACGPSDGKCGGVGGTGRIRWRNPRPWPTGWSSRWIGR
jgi:hypothetical protein